MTFRQFAFNNVVRNKRLYAAYFLASLFTVMVFFTFSIFASHPELTGDNMNSHVSFGMNVAAGIIYVFSFFFVLYSMSSFLQSRKKEFGLLMIQGMSMRQIRSMVFLENMFIGCIATIGGIGLGLVFAKGILLIAENVLIIESELPFYFPIKAILTTLLCFIVLFFFISLFVSYVLRSRKLIELIKGDKQPKAEPKANLFLTMSAALLLGVGYAVALFVEGLAVIAAMVPVIIVVIIGTYLLFTQLSVFVIRRLKQQDKLFWHKTNMLLLSDLSFRMKDNARTFFLVAIVSTVAFSAIGTLYGFQTYVTAGVKTNNPYTLSYMESDGNEEQNVAFIEETLQSAQMEANKANMILRYYETEEGTMVLIAKQSDHNRFAELIGEETVLLQDEEQLLALSGGISFAENNQSGGEAAVLENATIDLGSGITVKPDRFIVSKALPAWNSYYIVPDHDFEKLPSPSKEVGFHAWKARGGESVSVDTAEELYEQLPSRDLTVVDYEVYQINKAYGPIMFVGLFIGIVFFVSAGSFLYFRLYSDLDEDRKKFGAIAKIGLTEKELKKVLNRQTVILFFAPIVIALIHGAVALTALSHMFYYNLFKESAMVLGIFLAIQVIYFFVVRFYYTRQIKMAIQ